MWIDTIIQQQIKVNFRRRWINSHCFKYLSYHIHFLHHQRNQWAAVLLECHTQTYHQVHWLRNKHHHWPETQQSLSYSETSIARTPNIDTFILGLLAIKRKVVKIWDLSIKFQIQFYNMSGIFLGLIWGRISAPSQFKNEQKLPKIMYIIPNFLVLHFGENSWKSEQKHQSYRCMKNCIKMWMKSFHSYFYAIFHEFFHVGN